MSNRFADIPTRGYGKTDPSWWNYLQAAGLALEQLLGGNNSGAISETAFAFANNNSSPANVTGLLFSSASSKSAWCWISVRRNTGSNEIRSEVELWLTYSSAGSAWQVSDQVEHGQASGLTFSVTSGGQVQYTSSNLSGTSYVDASKFKAMATGI